MSHRPVREEYDRLAASYERRWRHYIHATNAHTLRALALRPGARVLDLGCGTGPLLDAITRSVPDVVAVGLDLSAECCGRPDGGWFRGPPWSEGTSPNCRSRSGDSIAWSPPAPFTVGATRGSP